MLFHNLYYPQPVINNSNPALN
eukprot:UN07093